MIYSFHHFYDWVKGGVESGMAYRAKIFRQLGLEAKFVFATTFTEGNMYHEMERLDFRDSEILWLYSFFTDVKYSPCIYTFEQLSKTFPSQNYNMVWKKDQVLCYFDNGKLYYAIHFADETKRTINYVMLIVNGCLIRKDYYSYCKIYSEYYAPKDGSAHLYQRRYFNEDGTIAYEEIMDGDSVMYKFPDCVLFSREELVAYMMKRLHLTKEDVVLIDGEPGMIDRAAFIQNAAPAKLGLIIHADHMMKSDEEHVFWYYIYEYAFEHPEKLDFFITNTSLQSDLLKEQLKKYKHVDAKVLTIPVMGIDEVKVPLHPRKKHSLVSAGRLAKEKNMNWVIEAVAMARKYIPDITLDIYGDGLERENLQRLIEKLQCEDSIQLCGFCNLADVYQQYDAYISASFIETFGITLLEAVASGLPIVGFDIQFGAKIFIDEGKNGYRVPYGDINGLAHGIVRLFSEADIIAFREHSYEIAKRYYREEIEKKWKELLIPEK